MKRRIGLVCFTALVLQVGAGALYCWPGPFDGQRFQGRIAYSADGNHNDEDDWAASPVALAIIAGFGFQDKLVHFDYNSILNHSDPEWEKIHETSVLGAVERYGYDRSLFFNCRRDLDGALASITQAINASSAEDPLYFIIAGPMEVAYRAILKSDAAKRKYVYCISHSRWNDGFATDYTFNYNKRDVIPLGVKWVQIRDQNEFLSTSRYGRPARAEEWAPFHWMRDSTDANVRFLWERLQVTTRADCSDAGMAYFLMSGDEESEIDKVRRLLAEKKVPAPRDPRPYVRIEAENFLTLDNYELNYRNDRQVSHRINVQLAGGSAGRIRTAFEQPYTAPAGRYDVEVRYFDEPGSASRLAFAVNGIRQGAEWRAAADDGRWHSHTIPGVNIQAGDEIMVELRDAGGGQGKLDYVQLNYQGPSTAPSNPRFTATGPLDDPRALPGQVIVAGSKPGYLKYNGAGPAFLSGPDNPEDFLFRGTLNPDGTRSGGGQERMIEKMARAGVNGFHTQMFRMRRCNIKDEGDDTHAPFVDHEPSKGLNQAVLDQWDRWLTRLEDRGIMIHLEFYNDATDVERMGWKLDADGNLHPDERRWIEGIVRRFKHHKNILWGIEESANKLPGSRTPHFRKIGEAIAQADNYNHPIVQSFVVENDPDGDFPEGGVLSDAYIGDPNIRVVTWLHVVPHKDDLEAQHREYLQYYNSDAGHFVVLKNETFHHPRKGPLSRRYMWSCAMAGIHTLEAYHHADDGAEVILREDGLVNLFMERTGFPFLKPRDDLAAGSTRWVLAKPGEAYVAYTYDYSGPMGVKGLKAGAYDLTWFDTVDGGLLVERGVAVPAGEASWSKPDSMGDEIALYVERRARPGEARRYCDEPVVKTTRRRRGSARPDDSGR